MSVSKKLLHLSHTQNRRAVIGPVIGSEPVLLHRDQQRAPHLYIGSTAWAAFAVFIEPVSAKGLFHCFLDHPLPKALLHELLPLSRGRQVLVSEVTQLIYGTMTENRTLVSTRGLCGTI